jgi:hypothetical protein
MASILLRVGTIFIKGLLVAIVAKLFALEITRMFSSMKIRAKKYSMSQQRTNFSPYNASFSGVGRSA